MVQEQRGKYLSAIGGELEEIMSADQLHDAKLITAYGLAQISLVLRFW